MKKTRLLLIGALSLMAITAIAQQKVDRQMQEALWQWKAGTQVDAKAIQAFGGEEYCFVAEPIPDCVWLRMQGKTYKENPQIGRDDLRHIKALHRNAGGAILIGEMICNKAIADDVVDILHQLYKARYPIERMVLPDEYDADDEKQMRANNSSSFCYRVVSGSKVLSHHARGMAVDINTLYNPYVKKRNDGTLYIQPETAGAYVDRARKFPYKIEKDDLCYRLFIQHGFTWGGNWKSLKDYQHFEK